MRGYVFTLDAVVGVALAAGLITSFFAVYGLPARQQVLHQRAGTDSLFVIDAERTLTGATATDNDSVRRTLNRSLPQELHWRYNITYYDVSGTDVVRTDTIHYDRLQGADDAVTAVRPVLIFDRSGLIPDLAQVARAEVTAGR